MSAVWIVEARETTNDAGCIWEFLAGSSPADEYCPDSVAMARMRLEDNYASADVQIRMLRDPYDPDQMRWMLQLEYLELRIGYDMAYPLEEPVVLADGASPQAVTVPVTVEMRLEYPTRLAARLEELDRTGWGRTWNREDEVRDLRRYDAAILERLSWWPGGRVRVRVWGQEYTLEPETEPAKLPRGRVSMTGYFRGAGFSAAPGRSVDYFGGTGVVTCRDIRSAGASPSFEPWDLTIRDHITWPHELGEVEIVRLTAADNRLTGRMYNVGLETDLRVGASFSPARTVTAEADLRDGAGEVLDVQLQLQPTGLPPDAPPQYAQPDFDTAFTGPGSRTWVYRDYRIRGGYETFFGGPGHYHVIDEIRDDGEPVFAWTLGPEQLEQAGLDRNAWRCPILLPLEGAGWEWGYLYLIPYFVADPCNSLQPWSSSGTLALAGGGIRCSGPAGRWMGRSWTAQQACWGSCRFLLISAATAGPGRTGTLRIGQKTWEFESDGAETELRFDLLAPSNLQGVDTTETLNEPAYGWGWGVESPLTLRLTFDSTDDWIIKRIRFVRESRRHLLIQNEMLADLPAFRDRESEDEVYIRRMLAFLSEGKVVADERLGKWNRDREEVAELRRLDDVIGAVSVDGLWGRLGGIGDLGIVGAFNNDYSEAIRARPPVHDQWLDPVHMLDYHLVEQWAHNGRWAYHMVPVCRAVRTGAGGEDYEDAIGLPAHLQVDYIAVGQNVTPVRLVIPRILGGAAHGMAAAPGDGALDGALVHVSDRDDTVWHVCPAWRGAWRSPGLRQGGQHHVTLNPDAPPYPAAAGDIPQGRLARVCIEGEGGAEPVPEGIHQTLSVTQTLYRVYGQAGMVLMDRQGPSGWKPPRALFPGSWPSIAVLDHERGRRLRIVYETAGAVWTRVSMDDGESWSEATMLVADAGRPFILHDAASGITYVAWRAQGGQVRVGWSVDGGQTLVESHTAAASSDDDAVALSVVVRPGPQGRERQLILSYRSGGAVTSLVSRDNGRSWTTA